jgi:uncharacterized protein
VSLLIVLAKAPLAGQAKTRLCPPLTHDEAAMIAAASLSDTFAACRAVDAAHVITVFDGEPGQWVPTGISVVAQREGGLDVRLGHAFADVWSTFPEPAVLIAMDTPHVDPQLLTEALHALTTHDCVFGPATDGGFWLIGLRADLRVSPHELFAGVPMSKRHTGEAQRTRLAEHNLSVYELRELGDIDTIDDVRATAQAHPNLKMSIVSREILARYESNEGR